MERFLLCILFCLFIATSMNAQGGEVSNDAKVRPFLTGGMYFGGSGSANNLSYASGGQLLLGLRKEVKDNLAIGGGVGIHAFDNTLFYPVYLEALANFGKNADNGMLFRGGYALANKSSGNGLSNVKINGGAIFETGKYFKFQLSPSLEAFTSLTFRFQRAVYSFEDEYFEFDENVDYYGIGFQVGFRF